MSSTRLSIQTVRCLAGEVAAANWIEVAADCDPAARITHAMRLSAYPHWPIDRKPHECSLRDGARIVVREGARDTARYDCVVDACRQDVKGRAPVQ
jgi:hypothetical protein